MTTKKRKQAELAEQEKRMLELADYLAKVKERQEKRKIFCARDEKILLAMIEASIGAHAGYASDAAYEAMQSVLDDAEKKEFPIVEQPESR